MVNELQAFASNNPTLAGWAITLALALAAVLATLVGVRLAWAAASRLARTGIFVNVPGAC